MFFQPLLLLSVAAALWIISFSFAVDLRTDLKIQRDFKSYKKELSWFKVIFKRYDGIKELCQNINETFGSLFATYLAYCLMAQAAGLDVTLVITDNLLRIQIIFLIIVEVSTFTLAADASDKVNI